MIAATRRKEILARVNMDGAVSVAPLALEFGVTEETVRRDLEKLERDGLLKRSYGGAVRAELMLSDLPFELRRRTNIEAKKKIALSAASLVADGDVIGLDSSSTALFVAHSLLARENLTLITNSVEILLAVSHKSGWRIISTGGKLKENALSFTGERAAAVIREYRLKLCITSCKGLSSDGADDANEEDAMIKRAFIVSAAQSVLAADSDKFGLRSLIRIAPPVSYDILICDKAPDAEIQRGFAVARIIF